MNSNRFKHAKRLQPLKVPLCRATQHVVTYALRHSVPKLALSLLTLVVFAFSSSSDGLCQEQRRKLLLFSGSFPSPYSPGSRPGVASDFSTGVGTVLDTRMRRSGIFDNFYIDGVRRLQLESNPTRNPNDIDEQVLSRAAQRVLTVQSTDAITATLNNSELRDTYRRIAKGIQRARDVVKVSIRSDHNGLQFTQKQKGAKLIEFHLEPNDRTFLAPHLTIVDAGRIRYDPSRSAVMFEVRRDW